jgi:hypothetical protein
MLLLGARQSLGKHSFTTIGDRFPWGPCRGVILETIDANSFKPTTVHRSTNWATREYPCGGGVEYLHRDPASRRRQRKGSLKFETVKYGSESQGIRTRERLSWQGPAACINDRPILSSERAPHKEQDRNCQTVINIWSWAPDGVRHQDLLTDWPSVAMWLWLD